jgi:hypothetical protein
MMPSEPSPDALRTDLLDSLTYEGAQGLWEVAWRLDCSPGQPESVIAKKVELARHVTLELLEQGQIEVWLMNSWPPTSYTLVASGEFLAAQANDLLWFAPDIASQHYEIRLREAS